VITAQCFGGLADGEWVTVEREIFEVYTPGTLPAIRVADVTYEFSPYRVITYRAMWIRPSGWRVAFPVFVVLGQPTDPVAERLDETYGGYRFDAIPIEMGAMFR